MLRRIRTEVSRLITRKRLAAILVVCGALALTTSLRDSLDRLGDEGNGPPGQERARTGTTGVKDQTSTVPPNAGRGNGQRGTRIEQGGPTDDTVPEVEVVETAPRVKTARPLTNAEEAIARRLIAGDTRLSRLVDGQRYRITELMLWSTRAGQREGTRKVGATAFLSLARAKPLAGHWPLTTYASGRRSRTAYKVQSVYLRFRRVREVMVNVDLRLRKVVSIAPAGDARVISVPAHLKRTTPQD
jgi:hypothetical protein